MKTTLVFNHMEESEILRGLFLDKSEKVVKYLKRFKDDETSLHGALDKNPHREEFFASLTLYLPSASLHVGESGRDCAIALNKSFLALARQLKKHNEKQSNEKRRLTRISAKP